MIPADKWDWYGYPAHFVGATNCRFRMTTRIGNYIVSSVGDLRWQNDQREPSEIGCDRLYETYVFKVGARCDCGCGERRIDGGQEIDSLSANDAIAARANHMKLCRKYARKNK
jgi:hypothetical protein